jgi:hypothetical protein
MTRLLLGAMLALACAVGAHAKTFEVGQGKQFKLPSEAIKVAGDGDTISIYPGEYFDCAQVPQNRLIIQGVGNAEEIAMTDKPCAGKALLITEGSDITVRNITLTRVRVPDLNGAGIRDEGQNLVVERVRFVNNQNGILTGRSGGTLTIRDSYFEKNGFCERNCAHGLYVGQLDLLRVERTKFVETRRGHHIKSRALRTEVIDCDIEDGPNGTASYEIEIPSGGSLLARGNKIVKGPRAENHTAAIVIGTEGVIQPTRELIVEDNDFRSEGVWSTFFVWNLTATEVQIRNNKTAGKVSLLKGDGQVSNNVTN